MIILLFVAALIYFISGKTGDGIFLASAIVIVSAITLFQDTRSRNALKKLNHFAQPMCKVIRNGKSEEIKSEDLVIGDSLIVEEETSITADGIIVHSNDFSVNESILTGESFAVFKDKEKDNDGKLVFHGTTVANESLHETPLIANTIARKKLFEMNRVISDTAEYGCYLFDHACKPLLADFI